MRQVQHTFAIDYNSLAASTTKLDQFKQSVRQYVADAAKVQPSFVTIVSVRPGSVVTETQVSWPSGGGFTEAQVGVISGAFVPVSTCHEHAVRAKC